MPKTNKATVVAGIIVNQKGEVLIVQRNPNEKNYANKWELPSGKLEPGETIIQAFAREVLEETGLKVKLKTARNPTSQFQYTIQGRTETRLTTQKNYVIKLTRPQQVKLSPEHIKYAWAKPKDLPKYDLIEGLPKVIATGYKRLAKIKKLKQ